MRPLGVLTALAVVCPSVAYAAPTETAAQPTVAEGKPAAVPAKVICKQVLQTGTRFKKRSCGRAADWKRLEEESMRARQELDSGGGANTAPSG
jgi:hypothetical protein